MAISNSANNNTITVKQGRQILQLETSSELIAGQKWYILNQKWWLEFVDKVEKSKDENEVVKMPPISNEDIVVADDPDYALKPNLQLQVHITVLPEQVFNQLKKAYGLAFEKRDIITREVVKGTLLNQSTFIEIYPLMIKIADYSNKEDIHTISISQADSVEKIRKAIMDRLNINEKDRRSAQFLVEDNGKYEALPDPISHTKLSALLNAGVTVFVDSQGTANLETAPNNGSTRAGTRYSAYTSRSPTNYQRGVCGLQNLGNTCFMNSALQCLSNVPEMTEYFLNNEYQNEINEQNLLGTQGRLVKAYAEMLQEMWSGQASSVRPWKLKCVIGEFAPRFNGYAQQDSQELTAFLLDGLHEDLNRIKKKPYIEEKEVDGRNEAQAALEAWQDYKKRNDSIIVDLLHGQLKSTLTCNICEKVSIKFDPFCFLSVPIPVKERQMKSTTIFIRKNKWAKFSITHTSRTTIRQLKNALRENLKIPEETQIVMTAFYDGEILKDDQMMMPQQNFILPSKQFYAFAVEGGEGPVLIVENRLMRRDNMGALLGVPFPVRFPERLTRQHVFDHILPICRDYFWHESAGTSAEDKANGNEMDGAAVADMVPAEMVLLAGRELHNRYDRQVEYAFPEANDEEIDVPDDAPIVKLVIKWDGQGQFSSTHQSAENLVDREVNLVGQINKKCYSLKECIDLYTTQEQLNEEDSWYCPRCKKHQQAYKKLELWSLPHILIIHLKRFIFSRYTRDKIDTEIEIPVRGLDFSDKVLDPAHKQEKYDLIGISNHCGGLGGGHYTAKALNGDTWCEFNDSSAYTLNNPMGDTITSREAYMLVYRRRGQQQQNVRKSQRIAAAAAAAAHDSGASNSTSKQSVTEQPSKRRVSESKMETD